MESLPLESRRMGFIPVPTPARFCFNKLIVAHERDLTALAKANKDVMQAAQIMEVLLEDRMGDVLVVWDEIQRRGKGWVKWALRSQRALEKEHESIIRKASAVLGIT